MALALQFVDVILSFKGRFCLAIDLVFREGLLNRVRLRLIVAEFWVGRVFGRVGVEFDGACFGVSMHMGAIMKV